MPTFSTLLLWRDSSRHRIIIPLSKPSIILSSALKVRVRAEGTSGMIIQRDVRCLPVGHIPDGQVFLSELLLNVDI